MVNFKPYIWSITFNMCVCNSSNFQPSMNFKKAKVSYFPLKSRFRRRGNQNKRENWLDSVMAQKEKGMGSIYVTLMHWTPSCLCHPVHVRKVAFFGESNIRKVVEETLRLCWINLLCLNVLFLKEILILILI